MDFFSDIIAGLITVLFLFFAPILMIAQKQDQITQSYVESKTVAFVNNIQTQGKITQSMYNIFIKELDATGNLYNIEMTHTHNAVIPVFDSSGNTINTDVVPDIYYEDEILIVVYEKIPTAQEIAAGEVEGEYHLNKGDSFSVTVQNREDTLGYKITALLQAGVTPNVQILATYGGVIRDENY